MKIKSINWWVHGLGIVLFLCIPILFAPHTHGNQALWMFPQFQKDFISFLMLALFYYLSYYVLIPKYFQTKRYIPFFSVVLVCFLGYALLPSLLIPHADPGFRDHGDIQELLEKPNHTPEEKEYLEHERREHNLPKGLNPSAMKHLLEAEEREHREHEEKEGPGLGFQRSFFIRQLALSTIARFGLVLLFSLVISIYRRLREAESERKAAELNFLKAQVNPHFLFNSLNTIYSMSITKSEETPDAVLNLAESMRYVLNEGAGEKVELEKEIKYIKNFIALQRMRFNSNLTVEFNVDGTTAGLRICPLILIPFIENAFKYGVSSAKPSTVVISISIKEKTLEMVVENTIFKSMNDGISSFGVGISNARRRLELMYSKKFELNIQESDNHFKVVLSIGLYD